MALPQPILIFRKDLRHLWPETLVVLALFVAFAWSAPSHWTSSPYAAFAPILAGFLKLLMPIAWLVMISRLIHDESLVGDRQFWTSRPYHWAKLLVAKLLYIVAFLYLPFLLMQCFLLLHAGLHPTSAIPALLHNLLLLTVIIVIPVTALAAVTSTFARLLLSVLGAILYVLALGLMVAFVAFQRLIPPALTPILTAIFILLPAIALLYQYATRRTAISRILLIATPLLIVILVFLTPATALIRHAYPVASGSSQPTLAEIPQQYLPKRPQPGPLATFRNQAELAIPFSVTGTDPNSNYTIQGAALTVHAAGVNYSGPYASAPGEINAGTPFAIVRVPIPLDVYNKIKSIPADIHLSIAVQHIKAQPAQTWKATRTPFSVPGHGLCSYSTDAPDQPPTCRYPFQTPELNLVSAPLTLASCEAGGQSAHTVPGQGLVGGSANALDFDPVVTAPLNLLPNGQKAPPGTPPLLLCPGTPLSFIEATKAGKHRFELDEKKLILENYASHPQPSTTPQQVPPGMQIQP